MGVVKPTHAVERTNRERERQRGIKMRDEANLRRKRQLFDGILTVAGALSINLRAHFPGALRGLVCAL